MLAVVGLLSGLIFVLADIPYIKDTLSGETKPHRTSWFLYFVFNAISIANQTASGATNSLWYPIAGAITTLLVFVLSIKRGVGGYQRLDIICLIGALAGVGLWIYFDNPTLSIIANLVATSFAVTPTIKKAYLKPRTETKITYALGAVSSALAAISVGKIDWVLLLLPIYGFVVQFGIYALLIIRRTKVKF